MSKNVIIVIIIVNIASVSSIYGKPDMLWTKTFGGNYNDWGNYVQQTNDGGYIIVGTTSSYSAGYRDVWLIKTDTNGNKLWDKTYGGSANDAGLSVQQTLDGGYIIGGAKDCSFPSYSKTFLIKTDSKGDTIWTKTFEKFGSSVGYSVKQTIDNGYILVGPTSTDIGLIKTDNNGDTLWTKVFGRSRIDEAYSVQQTADGGYVIIGSTHSYSTWGSDIWLIKTDVNGDSLWTKVIGSSSYTEDGRSGNLTSDGGYIIAGHTNINSNVNVLLLKTDSKGDLQWTKDYGGYHSEMGYSVQQTSDDGYIIVGNTYSYGAARSNVWIIKTNTVGDTLWTKVIGGEGSDCGYAIQQTSYGGYIIVGYTDLHSTGDYDVWLIKLISKETNVTEFKQFIPKHFSLFQNYPNPFNLSTTISYSISNPDFVVLKVNDILGREIQTLVSEFQEVNTYSVNFNANGLSSGIYFYKLKVGSDFVDTKKMLLLR